MLRRSLIGLGPHGIVKPGVASRYGGLSKATRGFQASGLARGCFRVEANYGMGSLSPASTAQGRVSTSHVADTTHSSGLVVGDAFVAALTHADAHVGRRRVPRRGISVGDADCIFAIDVLSDVATEGEAVRRTAEGVA